MSADVREILEPPLDVTDERESSDSNRHGPDSVRPQKKKISPLCSFFRKIYLLERDVQLLDERMIIRVPEEIGTL
jgi:hypothetical protein